MTTRKTARDYISEIRKAIGKAKDIMENAGPGEIGQDITATISHLDDADTALDGCKEVLDSIECRL